MDDVIGPDGKWQRQFRYIEQGEPNEYVLVDATTLNWVGVLQLHGGLLVEEQRQLVRMLTSAPELVAVLNEMLNGTHDANALAARGFDLLKRIRTGEGDQGCAKAELHDILRGRNLIK